MLHPHIQHAGLSILASQNTDVLLSHRHLYLRNPLILALNLYRSQCFSAVHEWFKAHQFIEISAPLITPSILYKPSSAIHISNLKTTKSLFLSQCAGFYLEAAAHAHERVYNLGPSFRNESRTNRHLMEYWHIKAELCSGEMKDIHGSSRDISGRHFQTVFESELLVGMESEFKCIRSGAMVPVWAREAGLELLQGDGVGFHEFRVCVGEARQRGRGWRLSWEGSCYSGSFL